MCRVGVSGGDWGAHSNHPGVCGCQGQSPAAVRNPFSVLWAVVWPEVWEGPVFPA